QLAVELIEKEEAEASFKKVPGYYWATCVNVNAGLVHGIPKKEIVFKKGDIVSVDLGVYFKGFHTDCSFSKGVDVDSKIEKFLTVGKEALKKAIAATIVGNRIYDISEAIEKTVISAGYSPIRALVGHGVGRELHEDPQIPCFLPGPKEESTEIAEGATFAIEVMYALGGSDLVQENDGWTIATRDGKISALFEETVAVVDGRPKVLTDFFG
ncbi:MAG: type I methionyl aminopeptidase, partial [Candidatus Woesebacteria bacterium]|nr:type I methionyl aminopeptidase [Candidatus Woesebacteria bacterium]